MFQKLLKIAKQRQGNKYLSPEQKQSYYDNFAKPCVACKAEGKTTKAVHDVFGHLLCDEHFKIWRAKAEALRKAKQETNDQKTESPTTWGN